MGDLPMRLREPVAADVPLLTQTYVRESRRCVRPWERDAWPPVAERWLARQLMRRRVIVAADSDESSDVVLGYAIGEPGRLDWVWVKGLYRRVGLARRLTREVAGDVQMVTHICTRWQRETTRRRGWLHAPMLPLMEMVIDDGEG